MNTRRLVIIVVTLSLLVIAAFTMRTAIATSAIVSSGQDLSDYALRHPNAVIPITTPDISDYVLRHPELLHPAFKSFDTSYDEVERIRAQFQIVGFVNLPFGPGLAATYGKPNDAQAAPKALPFGPGLTATYGTPSERVTGWAYPLPFGPGWAATYGVPAR